MFRVYSKTNCPECFKAKYLLDSAGLQYKEEIIGIHIMRESFVEMFPNVRKVPLIVETGADGFTEIIGGYKELEQRVKAA